MTFVWPPMLLAVLIVPLGVIVARRIDDRRRQRMAALSGQGWSGGGARAGSAGASAPGRNTRLLDRLPGVLTIVAFVVLAVALARPQATVSLPRIEGTVVLTFDVSGSMAADDVTPSRMEAAKVAAKAIVDRRPQGVVVGVVAFSDSGLSIQTPTNDQAAVLQAIDRLGPARGTSLGQGILASLGAIAQAESDTPAGYYSNRSAAPTDSPAPVAPGSHDAAEIVLFSDGENNERPEPLAAAQTAADLGIRIQTIGVGTAAGTTLDLDGFRVQTQLDEDLLRQIADVTTGAYQPAAELDPGAVYTTLAQRLVARDEALEITALVAGAGLVLLIVAGVTSLARSGRLP
jgi:Ca-activated chloride channel family protein